MLNILKWVEVISCAIGQYIDAIFLWMWRRVGESIYMLNVKRLNPPQNCSPSVTKTEKLRNQPSIEAKTIVAGCMDKWFGEKRLWLFGNHLPLLPRRWGIHAWKGLFGFAWQFIHAFVLPKKNAKLFAIDWYRVTLPERQTHRKWLHRLPRTGSVCENKGRFQFYSCFSFTLSISCSHFWRYVPTRTKTFSQLCEHFISY